MAKVITFSRTFPSYHPKKGQETKFVEKFLNGVKCHTIRAGNRWNIGDKFSPRFWSGKPYRSPQIIIAADTEIKKVWDFEIKDELMLIDNKFYCWSSSTALLDKLADNDGLSRVELLDWFKYPKDFKGQIICWNENINY